MRPMRIIDRFTRDRVSRYVWAVLTIGCLVTALLAGQRQATARGTDVANEVSAVQAEARTIANTVLFTSLSYATMTAPIPSSLYRDMILAIEAHAFIDPNVARVRIWRPDGLLQFSTHERDQVGILKAQDKTLIDQAMQGRSVSARVLTRFSASSTGNDQTPTNLLEVFVPLYVPDRIAIAGVAEVDYYYDTLAQAAHHPWFKLIVVFAVLALLCLIMTLLSLRTPERILGAGVVFALGGDPAQPRRRERHAAGPSTDKAARALQRDADLAIARANKAEADADGMSEQISESRDQLKQAEEAYHFLEAKMKQTLADLEVASAAVAEGATQVADLQGSLARAEDQISSLSADYPAAAQAQADLAQAHEHGQAALAAALEAAAAKDQEHAGITQKLTSMKTDLKDAKDAVKTAREEAAASALTAAKAQADAEAALAEATAAAEAHAAAAAAAAQAVHAPSAPEPPPEPAPVAMDDAVFAQLEERIVAAEQRAREAEARLQDLHGAVAVAPKVATDAEAAAAVGDLRSRLARTAARKRLGADEGPITTAVSGEFVPVRSGPEMDLQRSVAGEIRGPLSTLKGLSLALKGAVSTGEGKEMVRQLNASVKKLDRLTTDLAEVGEISDGSLRLNRRRADLAALVSRVVGEADGINDLDVRMELEPARASVDPVRLQQIVDGMLNHARERTGADGVIRIRLTGDDDGATIAVDDEGVPDTDIGPHLLLASRLTELHGGRLWSEPRTSGEGGSVKVFLPAAPAKT